MDRAYVAKVRQQRGYGTNPWSTGSRFLISHALLRNSEYAAPLRVWLEQGKGGDDQSPLQSLLILDEAHNAAWGSPGFVDRSRGYVGVSLVAETNCCS
jgi:hypothetical protein